MNKYNWQQDRNFVVTNHRIYNFKVKNLKRAIDIEKLLGLTKNLVSKSQEFVIHIEHEHDYRIISEHRDQIFDLIKINFATLKKKNIPIYGIRNNKSLRDFETTEKDHKHGISKIPLRLARIYEEDILAENESLTSPSNSQSEENTKFENQFKFREQQYKRHSVNKQLAQGDLNEINQMNQNNR